MTAVNVGDKVIVTAKNEFYAYVDGWRGVVRGFNNGYAKVICQRDDGEKTLFVPLEELALTV